MNPIASIFVWLGAGWAARRAGLGGRALAALNRFVVAVPLSAVILKSLHELRWEPSDWAPVSMAWIVFFVGAAAFSLIARAAGWSRNETGALVLCAGLGNTSFVGFPLLRALYGERVLPIAVLADQPGSFLALSTVGLAAAAWFSSGTPSARAMVSRAARFPPVWALLAAALTRPFAFPSWLAVGLGWGIKLLIPLALISVGATVRFDAAAVGSRRGPLAAGLLYKLILAPALIAAILYKGGETARITVLEAAMGPMVTGALVASEHGLDPELCSLLVGAGVPLCLVTVPLWAKALTALGF